MENRLKNNRESCCKIGKTIPMDIPPLSYDDLRKSPKRVEYILSPKNYPEHEVAPFLLKLKDEDKYLVFAGIQTLKLSSEESYYKITNKNIIRYIIRDHNALLSYALLKFRDGECRRKVIEYGNLTD